MQLRGSNSHTRGRARAAMVLGLGLLAAVADTSAMAAPPSSTLSGPDGVLRWTVSTSEGAVTVDGSSAAWTVHHQASAALQPIRTERVDKDGARYVTVYDANGASVTGPGGETRFDEAGLWDADTVDIRLGQAIADGADSVRFRAIDVGGPKVYTFQAHVIGAARCGGEPCTAVDLTLTGALRLLGPTWHYWFGSDGKLMRFDGPAGVYGPAATPAEP